MKAELRLQKILAGLTPLEVEALRAAHKSSAGSGHDFGFSEDVKVPGQTEQANGALVTSLIKKGLIWRDDDFGQIMFCEFTDSERVSDADKYATAAKVGEFLARPSASEPKPATPRPPVRSYFSHGPAGSHLVEEFESRSSADFVAQVGDVIRVGSRLRIVSRSTHARASHVALSVSVKTVVFRKGFDDERRVDVVQNAQEDDCCQRLPAEVLVKRLGPGGYEDFQTAKKNGTLDVWLNTQLSAELETHTEMKKNATIKKPARGGLAAEARELKAAGTNPEKTPKVKKTAAPAPEGEAESAKGRAAFIGKLVADGKSDADIIKLAGEKFPNTTEAVCKRIIKRKRK